MFTSCSYFTVDDEYIIRQLPLNELAYHARSNGNKYSVGIEICMHNGINQDMANENAAKLTAFLCRKMNLSVDDVVPHEYWHNKECPRLLLPYWNQFISKVQRYIRTFQPRTMAIFESQIIDQAFNLIDDEDVSIDGIEFNFKSCLPEDTDE